MESNAFGVTDLEKLLRETERAHGEYEQQLGHSDNNWPAWYARHLYERIPWPWRQEYIDEPEKLPSTEPYLSE
jgi:hypothetical protein